MSYDLFSFGKETKAKERAANNDRAAESARQTQNYLNSLSSRGARMSGADLPDYLQGQESAVLPLYLGGFEKRMGGDLIKAYDETGDVGYGDIKAASGAFDASKTAAGRRVNDLYNGGVEREMLNNAAPVQRGRVVFKRQSAIEGLNKTLADIEATQAQKGFQGDSYGARRLKLDANRGAASEIGNANLENLQDTRAIRDAVLQLQLQNLGLPFQLAASARNEALAPTRSFVDLMGARAALFNPLRVGGQTYNYEKLDPSYQPSFNDAAFSELGQVGSSVASGIAKSRASAAWNDYLKKQDAWRANYGNGQNYGDWSADYDYNGMDMSHEASTDYFGDGGGGGDYFDSGGGYSGAEDYSNAV